MTETEDEFPDIFFFQETAQKEHKYLELEKHMHSIWVVLIEPFLNYAASNPERKARLYLSWVSFLGPRFHRNSQLGTWKPKRETQVEFWISNVSHHIPKEIINKEFPWCL